MRRALIVACALALVVALAPPASAADGRVTRDFTALSYTLANVGGQDDTMEACSTGKRSQNEPSIAVHPNNPLVIVAGSNDYCAQIENGEVWPGYYRSTNGGVTWTNSLVPGYPADETEAGEASPVHGVCGAGGDPTQAFDNDGRLFYAFICFNRSQPVNGGVYVAKYTGQGATYERTVLVKRGTPSGLFLAGLFQDKINLTVDQTGDEDTDGNVYVAWSEYHAFGPTNAVLFSRSTDHGASFSRPYRVTPQALGTASFTDVAVGPDGTVYLTYLTYPSSARPTADVWLHVSTDAGASFGAPIHVASIELFDSNQFAGATGTYDCGDGPFACESGLTFSRFFSNSAVAADDDGVHVVWAAETETGLEAGQSQVFVRSGDADGSDLGPETPIADNEDGHQWFPDITSDGTELTVVYYDSVGDAAYDPDLPPGNTADGKNSGNVVNAYVAQSPDGSAWDPPTKVSSAGSNFGWETHGSRRVGFWGDYLYASAAHTGEVAVAWTDSRDLVPGTDPREIGTPDDDDDGFDVAQPGCVYVPNDINAPSYTSPTIDHPCLSQGGLDQNIYFASL
jgi:hypothetical protein